MGVSSQYVASSASIADGAVSEVKLSAEACSAAKMKKEGTNGYVLTSNGTGAVPSYQAAGTGVQDLVMIERKTLGSDTATVEFTSYAAGYKKFILVWNLVTDGVASAPQLYFNADNASGHYYYHTTYVTGTTQTIAEGSGNFFNVAFFNSANGSMYFGQAFIDNESPSDSVKAVNIFGSSTASQQTQQMNYWNQPSTDITTITIKAQGAVKFKTGGIATLYGLK